MAAFDSDELPEPDDTEGTLAPKDVEFLVANHEFEPLRFRSRSGGGTPMDRRERLAYGLHFIKLWSEGNTVYDIAERYDCSHMTVQRYMHLGWDTLSEVGSEQAKRAFLARVERVSSTYTRRALEGDLKAAWVLTRYLELEAKVRGLFAPVQVEATVMDQHDVELQEMIREAKAGVRDDATPGSLTAD